jgi:hypothetical protein
MSLTKRLHRVVFFICIKDPGGSMSYAVGLPSNLYKPITNTAWVHDWSLFLSVFYLAYNILDEIWPF